MCFIMFRDLIISFISHTIVFGSLLYASTFGENLPIQHFNIYRVKTVTPQSISELLKKTGAIGKPKPEIPQIQTKTKTLPKEHRKESQTVKRSSIKDNDTTISKSKNSGLKGIKTDTEFDFPEYLFELRVRIEQNWRPSTANETFATRIFFRIGKNGKILRAFVEKPTGNINFDASALQAVLACDPFSPLPDKFNNDNLGVHFDFIYEID